MFLDTQAQWAGMQMPVVYYFDKTGKNEPAFKQMAQTGSSKFAAVIPAGYTHIIFIDYDEGGIIGTWDNVLNQTLDLIIPLGDANCFNVTTNEWHVPASE